MLEQWIAKNISIEMQWIIILVPFVFAALWVCGQMFSLVDEKNYWKSKCEKNNICIKEQKTTITILESIIYKQNAKIKKKNKINKQLKKQNEKFRKLKKIEE